MLSDFQVPAHRAQPPTKAKNRWQPYPYQSLGPVPSDSDLNTPKPSVSPTPVPPVTPSNPNHPPIQREVGKQKYALGLIGACITIQRSLWFVHAFIDSRSSCEDFVRNMAPEDIPCAFVGPTKGALSPCNSSSSTLSSPQSSFVSVIAETDHAFLPMKTFVHEVLKRSRTFGPVMQTALCYLEAIRPKVPQILCDDKLGIRSYFMPESAILPATEAELQMDRKLSNLEESDLLINLTKTERLTDEDADCELSTLPTGGMVSHTLSASPLPSPLLCPRRTFLAALILAAKFSQDKCYSNRAWAKISGLPPREIGRCERALGQALDWRLWVGKKALTSSDVIASSVVTSSPVGPTRAVARTQSESSINVTASSTEPFMRPSKPKQPDPQTCPNLEAPTMGARTGTGLRRYLPLRGCLRHILSRIWIIVGTCIG
jgi:PHO85 cyclin-5